MVFEGMTEDEALEALLMADCNPKDVVTDDDCVTVTTEPDDYEACKEALLAAKPDLEFIESKVTFVPMSYVELDDETRAEFEKLVSVLESLDDVDVVYHNAD
jgi:transcriptional/translational regulatory protein YebC/TACO1